MTIKVGDIVRVRTDAFKVKKHLRGQEGTVTGVYGDFHPFYFSVYLPDCSGLFSGDELELKEKENERGRDSYKEIDNEV